MISKKSIIPGIAILVVGGSLLGATTLAYAETPNTPFSGLAQAIASKFNLNQTDVQNEINSFMQQHRADMTKNMQDREKVRLDKLVTAGKITSDQETAIINEYTSLRDKYGPGAMQGKTLQQRIQAKSDERNELIAWAKAQGIDQKYVLPFGGMRHADKWNQPTATPSSSQ